MKENPRTNIVSLRVNDEEREVLEQISRRTLKTVSEIMREAMQMATQRWAGFVNKADTEMCDCGMSSTFNAQLQ